MPTAGQVLAAAQGASERDTAAQASTALQLMDDIVRGLSPQPFDEQALAPAVKRRLDEYRQARAQVDGREAAKLPRQDCEGDNCEQYLYPRCQYQYAFSATWRKVVLDRHFEPAWQRSHVPRLHGTLWRDALRLPAGVALPQGFGSGMPCTGQGGGRLIEAPGAMDYLVGALGGGRERQAREFIDHLALPLAGVAALLALLLALHLRLLGRRLALDPADPLRVTGSSPQQLVAITGWVLSPSKGIQTITRVSGNDRGVSSSSETVVHDQFFIRSLKGEEREVKLTHVDLAVREGHQVSAVWRQDGRSGKGPFLLLRNHSLGETLYFAGEPHGWLNMGLRWLWLMLLVAAGFATYAHLAAEAAGLSRNALPLIGTVLGVPLLIGLVLLALALVTLRKRRLLHFRREVDERLVSELDRRAAGQLASGPGGGLERADPG